jgi:hypothetical protein
VNIPNTQAIIASFDRLLNTIANVEAQITTTNQSNVILVADFRIICLY